MKTGKQYEEDIGILLKEYRNCSSRTDTETEQKKIFRELSVILAEYCYAGFLFGVSYTTRKNIRDYGVEVYTAISSSIKYYDPQRGGFFSLLKDSIKKEIKKNYSIGYAESNRGGMRIRGKDEKNIRRILKEINLLEESGKKFNSEEAIRWIGQSLDMPPETVKRYLAMAKKINVIRECFPDNSSEGGSDGDKESITSILKSYYSEPDEIAEINETFIQVMDIFEEVFTKTQKRVKPYLRQLLSIKYYEITVKYSKIAGDYSFFDKEKIKEWKEIGKIPAQKEIAAAFNKNEADASRTLQVFFNKVIQLLPNDATEG
jgi:hypothetical protein